MSMSKRETGQRAMDTIKGADNDILTIKNDPITIMDACSNDNAINIFETCNNPVKHKHILTSYIMPCGRRLRELLW